MKRVKKSLRAYQLLSSAFTAAIVVAAVALLSVAGASDAFQEPVCGLRRICHCLSWQAHLHEEHPGT